MAPSFTFKDSSMAKQTRTELRARLTDNLIREFKRSGEWHDVTSSSTREDKRDTVKLLEHLVNNVLIEYEKQRGKHK